MVANPKAESDSAHETQQQGVNSDVPLTDILALAENSIENLKSILDSFDAKIYSEFREIADQINFTKTEISQLNASEMRQGRIPEAGKELHAIVESTEQATHKIMEAAETIMTADPSDQGNYYNIVNDNIMAIFEACSFQDLTGQRISRVVDTLEFIDKRVSKFANKFSSTADDASQHYVDDEEREKADRNQRLILNGPQDDEHAIKQDEIDEMLK